MITDLNAHVCSTVLQLSLPQIGCRYNPMLHLLAMLTAHLYIFQTHKAIDKTLLVYVAAGTGVSPFIRPVTSAEGQAPNAWKRSQPALQPPTSIFQGADTSDAPMLIPKLFECLMS